MSIAKDFETNWKHILKINNNDYVSAIKEVSNESIDVESIYSNEKNKDLCETLIYYFDDNSFLVFNGWDLNHPKSYKYLTQDEIFEKINIHFDSKIISENRIRTCVKDDTADDDIDEINSIIEKTGWRAGFTGNENGDEWDVDIEKIELN